jgi:hypothetical protein
MKTPKKSIVPAGPKGRASTPRGGRGGRYGVRNVSSVVASWISRSPTQSSQKLELHPVAVGDPWLSDPHWGQRM